MCRKLIYLAGFLFVLGLTSTASADLIGYWTFDEGSGNVAADSSGNGYDGTLYGNPNWVSGQLGGAIEFDGSNDYVGTDASLLDNMSEFTMAGWVSARNPGGSRIGLFGQNDLIEMGFMNGNTEIWSAASGTTNTPWTFPNDTWHHIAVVSQGTSMMIYLDGELAATGSGAASYGTSSFNFNIGGGGVWDASGNWFSGKIDDVQLYDHALTAEEIPTIMMGLGGYPYASSPSPEDGAIYPDTWVSTSWRAGDFAVSHNVYFGENFDDVNNGTGDTFQGNQSLNNSYFVVGFPGFPYPDGLVNGTTYYWRIDEVNDADPNSPWKGDVWNFTVPPKTAYSPNPADEATFVALDAQLKWTAGFGSKLHYVVFGEDFDEVNNAAMGKPSGMTNYNPGPLKLAKAYYWRVDEFDGATTHKGEVWSFTTLGAVSGPNPVNGAVDVKPSVILRWDAGAVAASHEVYFGSDADAVKNATTASPEYKGPKALGEESYNPGKLTLNTVYYWRIDEVNGASTNSPWAGNVWSFTTGDFFVIDDFEEYDAGDNQIWFAWHDGLGAGAPGVPGYVPGNGTGAAVGDETTASYTEETIVHGGSQAMPISYDNNKQGYSKYSEAEYTLTDQRDWTEGGVANLSLWFRGYPPSTGSFVEGPAGTFTMTGSGADIWDVGPGAGQFHDEFHFAYKTLSGAGSIVARVDSVENTNAWAKGGVMIRSTLNGDSAHAMMIISATSGVSFQRRPETGAASAADTTAGISAPYWVKIERTLAGNIMAYSSANGSSWQILGVAEPIQMGTNVYIGLAVTSHDAAQTCQAVFSNVTTTGSVGAQWANQDIGINSNAAEPLYVVVSNSAGTPAVVIHDDPAATQINTWTEWVIPLQTLADQGIDITNVDRIAIGLGTRGNMTIPGGAGKMFIDDIRLTQPAPEPEPEPQS